MIQIISDKMDDLNVHYVSEVIIFLCIHYYYFVYIFLLFVVIIIHFLAFRNDYFQKVLS